MCTPVLKQSELGAENTPKTPKKTIFEFKVSNGQKNKIKIALIAAKAFAADKLGALTCTKC